MSERDHIVVIQTPSGDEVLTCAMTSDRAHELFAWMCSYFAGIEITIEQVVPVTVETKRRVLWRAYPDGRPNEHVADAIRDKGDDDFEIRSIVLETLPDDPGAPS